MAFFGPARWHDGFMDADLPVYGPLHRKSAVMDLNFLGGGVLNPLVIFSRASRATFFNAAGSLVFTTVNTARVDFGGSPGNTPLGLLIEDTRTNGITNPRAEGAVPGTPGTQPTSWTTGVGIGISVIATGTESGMSYVDLRFFGTTTTVNMGYGLELSATIAALVGQTWTMTAYLKLVAGSFANSGLALRMISQNSVPAALTTFDTPIANPTAAGLATQRFAASWTIPDATTAWIRPQLAILFASGVAVDFTLRVAFPQLEQGAYATSVMLPQPATPAASTRAVDSALVAFSTTSLLPIPETGCSIVGEFLKFTVGPPANMFGMGDNGGGQTIRSFWRNNGFEPATALENVAAASDDQAGNFQGVVFRLAISVQQSGLIAAVNGAAPQSSAVTGTIPAGIWSLLGIGTDSSGTSPWNGYIRRLRMYNYVLTPGQLQAASSF